MALLLDFFLTKVHHLMLGLSFLSRFSWSAVHIPNYPNSGSLSSSLMTLMSRVCSSVALRSGSAGDHCSSQLKLILEAKYVSLKSVIRFMFIFAATNMAALLEFWCLL